jgi:hypothetical protein
MSIIEIIGNNWKTAMYCNILQYIYIYCRAVSRTNNLLGSFFTPIKLQYIVPQVSVRIIKLLGSNIHHGCGNKKMTSWSYISMSFLLHLSVFYLVYLANLWQCGGTLAFVSWMIPYGTKHLQNLSSHQLKVFATLIGPRTQVSDDKSMDHITNLLSPCLCNASM